MLMYLLLSQEPEKDQTNNIFFDQSNYINITRGGEGEIKVVKSF